MPSISKAGLNASISLSTRNGVDNLLDIDKNKVLNISKHLELRIVKVLGKVVATDYGGEEARNRPDDIPTVSAIELKWEAVRERIEGDVESFWAKFDELNPELVEQAQWKARKRNFLRKLIKKPSLLHLNKPNPAKTSTTATNPKPKLTDGVFKVPLPPPRLPQYKCKFKNCNKSFSSRNELRTHDVSHFRPYKCSHKGCTKAFTTWKNRWKHSRAHLPRRPFSCSTCGKSFIWKIHYQQHLRIHGERSFKCGFDNCGKSFTQRQDLLRHERTHTGEKAFRCLEDGCGKRFARPETLAAHKRLHSGKKPIACGRKGCERRFRQTSCLRDHVLRCHTKERGYECTESGCSKKFKTSSDLRRHEAKYEHRGGKSGKEMQKFIENKK